MSKPRIYFAHSLELRKEVAELHALKAEMYFDIENPFATRLNDFGDMTNEEIRSTRGYVVPSWVVKHDLRMIDMCDGMFVLNTNGASYGSVIEAAYCFFRLDIPVAFIVPEKYNTHPWLRHFAIHVGSDVDEAIHAMRTFFNIELSKQHGEAWERIEKRYEDIESKNT